MVAGPKFSFPDNSHHFKKLSVKLMVKIRLVDEDFEALKQREHWVSIDKVAERREGMLLLDQYMALSGQFVHYADYGPDSGGAKHSLEERPLFIPPEGYEQIVEDYIYVETPGKQPRTAISAQLAPENVKAAIAKYKKRHLKRAGSIGDLKGESRTADMKQTFE